MTRQELEMWLCGPDAPVLAPADIAAALGLSMQDVGDSTLLRAADRLRGLCFTVAVLRDLYPTDEEVRAWMRRPHLELNGRRPIDVVRAGGVRPVGELAAEHWRRPAEHDAYAGAREWWKERSA